MDHLKIPEKPLYDFPEEALAAGKGCLELYINIRKRMAVLDEEISDMMDDEGNIHDVDGNVIENHPKVVEYDELESKVIELEKGSIYVILYEALSCMKARSRTIHSLYEQIHDLEKQLEE